MAEQSDRVVIKFGPGRLDADRAIQREIDTLREEVETKTTLPAGQYPTVDEVEDIVTEVINNYPPVAGGGGFVIGIPPGTALAYAPLNLLNFPIDLKAVSSNLWLSSNRTNWPLVPRTTFSRDKYNVLGYGVDTILAHSRNDSDILAFSPSAGLLTTIDYPPTYADALRNVFSINGYLVGNVGSMGVTSTFFVYDGSNVNVFSTSQPVSGSVCAGIGPSADGNKIIMVWVYPATQVLYVQQYNPATGALEGTYSHVGLSGLVVSNTNGNSSYAIIDNGWIAVMTNNSGGALYVRKASIEPANPAVFGTTLKSISVPNVFRNTTDSVSILTSGKIATQSVSTDGTDNTSLVICDYAAGTSTVYPGAIFNPYDLGERPYLIRVGDSQFNTDRFPIASSIVAIDDTKFVVTGGTRLFDGTNYYDVPVSLYITLIDDPENPGTTIFTNAYISHEDYAYLNTTLTVSVYYFSVAKGAVALSDGSVAYTIGNSYSVNPGYCIMFNVKAVDYTP